MNGWKVSASLLCISIGLAAGSACSLGADRDPSAREPLPTAALEQHADGCGAFRYRDPANITCDYVAYFDYDTAYPSAGACLNDSQVQCTYPMQCKFTIDRITTACVDDRANAALCWSQYPPEASDPIPQQVYVFDLVSGSHLCEPPANAAALRAYCDDHNTTPRNDAYNFCRVQTSRNSGGTTCCQNCATPHPLDGGLGVRSETCGLDGGVGSDGGIGMDARLPDASVIHDAALPDAGSGSGSGF